MWNAGWVNLSSNIIYTLFNFSNANDKNKTFQMCVEIKTQYSFP